MSSMRVKSPLGASFAISGNWLHDGDEEHRGRVVGGTFRVTVSAQSAERAIEGAAEMMRRDIIVTSLEITR